MSNSTTTTGGPSTGLPYRPCAGIMLINKDGLVWTGRRIAKWSGDRSAALWQMPQGGIDPGETPQDAAIRELAEETGVCNAAILAQSRDWLHYDLPVDLVGRALKGKYRGQKQKWFAMRFEGEESDIDITARDGHAAEFDAWRWQRAAELPDQIVSFKRAIYLAVIEEFAQWLT